MNTRDNAHATDTLPTNFKNWFFNEIVHLIKTQDVPLETLQNLKKENACLRKRYKRAIDQYTVLKTEYHDNMWTTPQLILSGIGLCFLSATIMCIVV